MASTDGNRPVSSGNIKAFFEQMGKESVTIPVSGTITTPELDSNIKRFGFGTQSYDSGVTWISCISGEITIAGGIYLLDTSGVTVNWTRTNPEYENKCQVTFKYKLGSIDYKAVTSLADETSGTVSMSNAFGGNEAYINNATGLCALKGDTPFDIGVYANCNFDVHKNTVVTFTVSGNIKVYKF